ncbi:MAG: hypothetical protein SGI90_10740 [Candidatus Eisenbacteria bacterium]|nr:hypothetical protein [Candidatus Eisenbacteria bacterium]
MKPGEGWWKGIRRNPATGILGAGLVVLALTGSQCDECWTDDCDCYDLNDRAPFAPNGVYSVTGDGRVDLYWNPSPEEDLHHYRVYISSDSDGPFESIGETSATWFADRDARNGETEWYAVSAVDECGEESPLSGDEVFDTPRPEGHDLELWNRFGSRPELSGWDTVNRRRQPANAPGTDVWVEVVGGRLELVAAAEADIQDSGFGPPTMVDWAPIEGWSPRGRVELIEGHNYVIRTGDGYFARFHVVNVSSGRVVVDWAVQLDRGNRELSTTPPTEDIVPADRKEK